MEIMDKEITLDDIWRLSLKNYDGWHCIKSNTVGEDIFKEDLQKMEEESSESEDGDSDMDTD